MASLNGPFRSRTCAVGKGLTFQALLFRLSTRASHAAFSELVAGGAPISPDLGSNAPPATAAALDTNCLRVIFLSNIMRSASPSRTDCDQMCQCSHSRSNRIKTYLHCQRLPPKGSDSF